ncbi:MAG: type III-B CRISPR module RAMP protein Cmr6 [Desulfurococcaceae archaeon]
MTPRREDRSVKERSRGCSCLTECFESSPMSIHVNVVSLLSKSFVECFLKCWERCKDIGYVSEFSRLASERLMEVYKCNDDVKRLLENIKRYLDELQRAAEQVFSSVIRFEVELESRLTVHGSSHHLPLQISLAWDPVLNVPYVPSSSIRGVVRAFVEGNIQGGEVTGSIEDLVKLFGDTEHSSDVVFFDAYPVECRGEHLVEADVITPHYSEVEGTIDEARSSPVPLVFPVIAPRTVLHVLVALRKPVDGKTLENFMDKVREALESGLGAKTSVGYGRVKVYFPQLNSQ